MKYCIPIEKPETCGVCPCFQDGHSVSSRPWCGRLERHVDDTVPPSGCPITPMPDMAGMQAVVDAARKISLCVHIRYCVEHPEQYNGHCFWFGHCPQKDFYEKAAALDAGKVKP